MANHKYTILSRYNPDLHGTDYALLLDKWIPPFTGFPWIIRKHGIMSKEEWTFYKNQNIIPLYKDSHGYVVDITPTEHHSYYRNERERISKNGIVCSLHKTSYNFFIRKGVKNR